MCREQSPRVTLVTPLKDGDQDPPVTDGETKGQKGKVLEQCHVTETGITEI